MEDESDKSQNGYNKISGLLAAYSAYRKDLGRGKDPELPEDLFGKMTKDQLFFLGYAQMFCEPQPNNNSTLRQLQQDNHSPLKYRLIGSVKNCPMFYKAFQCPSQRRCFSKSP